MINVCSPFSFLILPAECSASTQTAWKLMPTHPCRSIIRVFLLAQAATEQLRLAQLQSLIKTSLKVTSTFRCSIWIQFWIVFETKESIKTFLNLWQTPKSSPSLIKGNMRNGNIVIYCLTLSIFTSKYLKFWLWKCMKDDYTNDDMSFSFKEICYFGSSFCKIIKLAG